MHLNPESPAKGELETLPTLGGVGALGELRALEKKEVMKEVVAMKEGL